MRKAACFLVATVAAGCGEAPVAPERVLTETVETSAFLYRYAPGDSVDIPWQDAYFAWITAELQVPRAPRLEYFKYRDRNHLVSIHGRRTNGFAEPGTPRFHTIWPRDNHEHVHTLVILHLGHPPALLNEGIAVAFQVDPVVGDLVPRWNGESVHDIARRLSEEGRIPPLAALVESPRFWDHPQQETYPMAGSFVRWLLDTHGLTPLRDYLADATFGDSPPTTRRLVQAAYARSLDSLWADWLDWLET